MYIKQCLEWKYVNIYQRLSISTIRNLYEERIIQQHIIRDKNQEHVIEYMEKLQSDLVEWWNSYSGIENSKKTSWYHSLFATNTSFVSTPKGLYLHGSVGCGKTFLMDLFYETCTIPKKKRIHFHEFMRDIHLKWHILKNTKHISDQDILSQLAQDIVQESPLLCLDEFQITHIGDAMLITQLYQLIVKMPLVLISTSNRHPEKLYEQGLQRIHFLPCIQLLQQHNTIIELGNGKSKDSMTIDYRKLALSTDQIQDTYLLNDSDGIAKFEKHWKMSSDHDNAIQQTTLTTFGRSWNIPITIPKLKIARVSFSFLCSEPRSASDYIELASNFSILFITDIPCMTWQLREEALRFIILFDALYEHKVKVICTAQVPIDQLFQIERDEMITAEDRCVLSDIGQADLYMEKLSIFTGEEEKFACKRTISRLHEMHSKKWWN